MRALVTGGAGFLGSHLCDRLVGAGHTVVALDNMVTGRVQNVQHLESESLFSLTEANLCEGIPVDGSFDWIFHLASPASPIDYVELPFETLYVGSDGTRHALERAVADEATIMVASTSEVYGDPAVHPQTEDYWGNVNPIGPRSVYDEAKRYSEALSMAFARYRGADVRIARIFNTYGPRMRNNDGRVIPAFGSLALEGRPLTVFGDGSQTRSFCFVSDLIPPSSTSISAKSATSWLLANKSPSRYITLSKPIIAKSKSLGSKFAAEGGMTMACAPTLRSKKCFHCTS